MTQPDDLDVLCPDCGHEASVHDANGCAIGTMSASARFRCRCKLTPEMIMNRDLDLDGNGCMEHRQIPVYLCTCGEVFVDYELLELHVQKWSAMELTRKYGLIQ